jgi:hypothetical protein
VIRVIHAGFGLRPMAAVLVRAYRFAIAPVLPKSCRFEPSCSAYAEEALQRHGFFRALFLIVRRILRCHPFHPGGYDPVP